MALIINIKPWEVKEKILSINCRNIIIFSSELFLMKYKDLFLYPPGTSDVKLVHNTYNDYFWST